METLIINTGSSSIKYQLLDMPSGKLLCSGLVERIGEKNGKILHKKFTEEKEVDVEIEEPVPNHDVGMQQVATLLTDSKYGVISNTDKVKLVGHRVVLGGEKFSNTTRVTDEVKKAIDELSIIAPLHNPPNLTGINVAERIFKYAVQVAVFDTSFHQTIPEYAFRYAIPNKLYYENGIRVYGYHGTSHRYVMERAAKMLNKRVDKVNLITIHLGNGASMTAIKNGKSIDTSLGMTPLEGLVMGTRCGNLDPGVIIYMNESLGIPMADIKRILNKESGMKGLTGENDLRIIGNDYINGDKNAMLALEIYCYRIKKYIGAYLAAIGEVDALVFTAGVGENSPIVREFSTAGLAHLGIAIDQGLNHKKSNSERDISAADSKIKTLVVPTNEEFEIARQSYLIFQENR